MRLRDLENAADVAWPAPIRRQIDGFELRRSAESSNRGNSVRRLGPDTSDLEEAISHARPFYADAGKLMQFCVTDQMPIVDRELARRGFEIVDECVFMVRHAEATRCSSAELPVGLSVTADTELTEDWLRGWAICAELPDSVRTGSFAVVAAVQSRSVYVSIVDGFGSVVSVGRAVDTDGLRGLHNLATRPDSRNSGIGAALVRALEAANGGSGKAVYMQVDKDSPAVRLYTRLGYGCPGGYHYRRQVPSSVRGTRDTSPLPS